CSRMRGTSPRRLLAFRGALVRWNVFSLYFSRCCARPPTPSLVTARVDRAEEWTASLLLEHQCRPGPSTLFADVDRLGRDPDRIAPVGPVAKVHEALRLIAYLAQRWKLRLRH